MNGHVRPGTRRRVQHALLWLLACLALSGCWFEVRFTDEDQLRLDPRFHGRWTATLENKPVDIQIASGRGCGLLQLIAEDETYRICSIVSAGDHAVLALHELKSEITAVHEYSLVLAHWQSAQGFELIAVDADVVLQALAWPQQRELRNAECETAEPQKQSGSGCTRFVLTAAALETSAAQLSSLYAAQRTAEKVPELPRFVRVHGK